MELWTARDTSGLLVKSEIATGQMDASAGSNAHRPSRGMATTSISTKVPRCPRHRRPSGRRDLEVKSQCCEEE